MKSPEIRHAAHNCENRIRERKSSDDHIHSRVINTKWETAEARSFFDNFI